MSSEIHKTAVLSGDIKLGKNVKIGPFCVLQGNISLGEDCELLSSVTILGSVTAGAGNTFHPYSVIGGLPQDAKFGGEETKVVIGDKNVFREVVTVSRGTGNGGGVTQIGSGNFFMASSHVAHDCIVDDDIIIANGSLIAGHCKVESKAYVSGLVAVHHFATIGKHAFIGGCTRVPFDAPPFMITQGDDTNVLGVNIVGLRRSGFKKEVIAALREAHRIIWRRNEIRSESIDAVRKKFGDISEIQYLVGFLERSMNGVNGRARERMRSDSPEHVSK